MRYVGHPLLTSSQAELEEGVLQMTLLNSSGEQHVSNLLYRSCADFMCQS